jgi:hypothetical protein
MFAVDYVFMYVQCLLDKLNVFLCDPLYKTRPNVSQFFAAGRPTEHTTHCLALLSTDSQNSKTLSG